MKILFRRIHLYLGIATGVVVMITCFTGALLVYEKELQLLFHHDRYYTKPGGKRVSADHLVKAIEKQYQGSTISSIKIYTNPKRNTEISFTSSSGEKKESGPRLIAFIDPYNGTVKEIYNHRESFFYSVLALHRWMLAGEKGKLVVGICTVIFLFITITGIIIWWPKNKAILKQRLKIKIGAGFKRFNHDYHVVLGFYSSIFLFIFAFTGLAWSFDWFNDGIYLITNSSKERAKPMKSIVLPQQKSGAENAISLIRNEHTSPYYQLALPKDSLQAFSVTILPKHAPHESATDTYYIDQYSGALLGVHTFASRSIGQRIRATFKPVHVASLFGKASKTLGFLACLIGTFLPISGAIMWVNRTRRKKFTLRRAQSEGGYCQKKLR